ncbi:MAG: TIGR04076 family protein, partial [Candidatus Thorarchaeota archaeon]|nr:TIGR04076 family protein [Candidatus Thorarchaeota archaeon]
RGKICISALYSMIPKVYAMMHNARFPWLKDQCVATHTCPDGWNPVMFELVRKASD